MLPSAFPHPRTSPKVLLQSCLICLWSAGCVDLGDRPLESTTDPARQLAQVRERNRIESADAKRELIADLETRVVAMEENWRGLFLIEIALAHGFLGEFHESVRIHQQAMPLLQQRRGSQEYAYALNSYASALSGAGLYAESLAAYEQARQFFEALDDPIGEAKVWANLGGLRARGQDFGRALQAYERSMELWHRVGDDSNRAHAGHNLAELYLALGHYRRALELCEETLEAVKQWPPVYTHTLEHMGVASLELGRIEDARSYLDQALEVSRRMGNEWSTARGLMHRAALDEELGALEDAVRRYHSAKGLMEGLGNSTGLVGVTIRLGNLALARGDLEEAEARFAAARNSAHTLESEVEQVQLAASEAQLLRTQGQHAAALERSQDALELLDSQRRRPSDADLRAYFFASKRSYYDLALDLTMDPRRPSSEEQRTELAFDLVERARSRSLLDLLPRSGVTVARDAPAALLAREAQSRATASSPRPVGSAAADEGSSGDDHASRAGGVDVRWAELLSELRREAPRYSALFHPEPIELLALQEQLDADTALIQYSLTSEWAYANLVTHRGAFSYRLAPSGQVVREALRLREALRRPGRRRRAALEQAATSLYDWLLRPLEPQLGPELGVARLIVVPDSQLLALPFEVLIRREAGGAAGSETQLALERWTISTVPSASVLTELRDRRKNLEASPTDPRQLDLLALAAANASGQRQLPVVRTEVQQIAALFPADRRRVFLDQDTWSDALALLPRAKIVHFAGHAEVNEDEPDLSYLRVAAGQQGVLTVANIYELRLAADLVVLAGCETALGEQLEGEGFLGFTRGFLNAGATALVVSLWRVADQATAVLMNAFYSERLRGFAPDEALRRAKLAVRSDPRWTHPFYWASFVLVGDGRSARSS